MSLSPLSPDDRAALLAVAWAAIRDRVSGGHGLRGAAARARAIPALTAELGAFVTLKSPEKMGGPLRLRGCMGTIEPSGPLHATVARCARDSALADPRFPRVEAKELDGLLVGISVIGTLTPIAGVDAIVPGRHGVVLTKPPHQALFLPQVAAEQRWGVEEMLEQLALKAGLPRADWRSASLALFEAQVF